MPELRFVVDGDPVAKGRPRFRRTPKFVTTYTPKKTRAYEEIVRDCAMRAMQAARIGEPLDEIALTVSATFYRAVPKSFSVVRRTAALNAHLRPLSRPDTDNLFKLVLDAMNGVVYRDDSLIVESHQAKFYSVDSRTEIVVAW